MVSFPAVSYNFFSSCILINERSTPDRLIVLTVPGHRANPVNLSSSYQTLISSTAGDYTTPITLTISGLSVGQRYEFEWCSNSSNGFVTPTTATDGNRVTLLTNTTGVDGGVGQFAIGIFTADTARELITTNQSGLSGLQLRELPQQAPVPEPATLSLFAIGAIPFMGYAWRRRIHS